MYDGKYRKPNGKFPMAGFVTEEKHTEKCTETTSEGSREKQCFFRDAPSVCFREEFIQKHQYKTDTVEND